MSSTSGLGLDRFLHAGASDSAPHVALGSPRRPRMWELDRDPTATVHSVASKSRFAPRGKRPSCKMPLLGSACRDREGFRIWPPGSDKCIRGPSPRRTDRPFAPVAGATGRIPPTDRLAGRSIPPDLGWDRGIEDVHCDGQSAAQEVSMRRLGGVSAATIPANRGADSPESGRCTASRRRQSGPSKRLVPDRAAPAPRDVLDEPARRRPGCIRTWRWCGSSKPTGSTTPRRLPVAPTLSPQSGNSWR